MSNFDRIEMRYLPALKRDFKIIFLIIFYKNLLHDFIIYQFFLSKLSYLTQKKKMRV
jgi:hypothetical protein